jgi:putative flippase GtrA
MRPETGFQLLRFSAVGAVNTGLHYGIFLVLLRVAGAHYLAASAIGYCIGLVNSYVMNRRWTFASHGPRRREFSRFVVVNLLALGANSVVLYAAVAVLGVRPEVGQVAALGFSTAVNFCGNRLWTFRQALAPA